MTQNRGLEDSHESCSMRGYRLAAIRRSILDTCEDYRTQMEGFLQASSVKVFVCEDRNRKAGMMVLKFSEAAAEIIGIAVSEKLRRRGIGKQLNVGGSENS